MLFKAKGDLSLEFTCLLSQELSRFDSVETIMGHNVDWKESVVIFEMNFCPLARFTNMN